jgi:CDP-diacylglycerol---glycerol-3-phosphate 3-phosphatidyltransferase
MIGASIGRGAMRIINAMVRGLASAGIHPNILTAIGVTINVGCGVLFGMGEFFWAGIVLIVANLFDMLDGNVARLTGNVTKFGGFLDSTLDRVSDMVCFVGIIIFYASNTPQHSLLNVFLGGTGLIGSVMVSYTTARSESMGIKANVGFLQRPERIVLFIIGALSTWDWNSTGYLANRMPQVLWVLAIGSMWTFVQRMFFIWSEIRKAEATTK